MPFLGGVDPAKRQPPFIRSPFQRQMGKGFDGCFINRQPVGFSFGREAEAVCFFAAGHLCLEGLSFGVSAPQERIPGSTGFVFSNEHGIVVIGAFKEYPGPDAGFNDLAADPALHQVGKHPAVILRCRRKCKLLFLLRLGRGRDVAGAFFTQGQHRVYKLYPFHLNEIVEGGLAADIPAFPMPEAGFFVDFEAVVRSQLKFTPAFGFDQFSGAVPLQKFNGGHLSGGGNLFFAYSGHGETPFLLNDSRPQDFGLIGAFPRKFRLAEMPIGGCLCVSWR